MSKTVREQVSEIQLELNNTDLQPDRAAEMLTTLASLFGNCLDYIRGAEADYNKVLVLAYETHQTANRAKLMAQNDPSYQVFREAQDTKLKIVEMMRSLKYFLRNKSEEFQAGRNF